MLRTSIASSMALEPFVDAAGAGEFLKLHPATVQRLAREGTLPGHPVTRGKRKKWRFLLSELKDWLSSKSVSCRANGQESG
jgi:phage terminase Nu1 subunit (DNA packaging protein)